MKLVCRSVLRACSSHRGAGLLVDAVSPLLPTCDGPSFSFDQLSHIRAVDLGDVNRALLVDGDRGRILEPVDALDHSTVLDAGDVEAVVLGAVDDVEAITLDENAPRRAGIRPLRDELAAADDAFSPQR